MRGLFIVMTFVVFFSGGSVCSCTRFHLFVGLRGVFYLLLVNLEHRLRSPASAATNPADRRTIYAWRPGRRRTDGLLVAPTVLYLLLEDYALLGGSVGLFVMLTLMAPRGAGELVR